MGDRENELSLIKGIGKWILVSVPVGIVVGIIGTLFHFGLEFATEFRQGHIFIIVLLPIGGVISAFLYNVLGVRKDGGVNLLFRVVRENENISLRTSFLIFITTIITHLFGGSAGREGAALQIGSSLSAAIGKTIELDEKDKRIIAMCGMSAGFATLFGTPVTAAIFAMEVISIGAVYYAAFVPCIISALIGFGIASLCGAEPTSFNILSIPELDIKSVLQVIILSSLSALLSIVFCRIMRKTSDLYKKYIPNQYIRIALGGAIVVLLTLLFRTTDYNGAGVDVINNAFAGQSKPEAFALKLLFTAITLGAGFKGGEIVPVFFIGATFGNIVSKILNFNMSFGTGIGLITLFYGVTNCPITSLILSVELFGSEGIILFAVACAISFVLSGYDGLYKEQKILYSKVKPVYIDTKVNG